MRRRTAARGYHAPSQSSERADRAVLQFAESALASTAEDGIDAHACTARDEAIEIQEPPVHLTGQQSPHRRLAAPHEADENDVVAPICPHEMTCRFRPDGAGAGAAKKPGAL
jgi:hypothetical protein